MSQMELFYDRSSFELNIICEFLYRVKHIQLDGQQGKVQQYVWWGTHLNGLKKFQLEGAID